LAGTVPAKIPNRDYRQIEVMGNAELLIGNPFTSYRPDLKIFVRTLV
jgi:hypothetical protein